MSSFAAKIFKNRQIVRLKNLMIFVMYGRDWLMKAIKRDGILSCGMRYKFLRDKMDFEILIQALLYERD
jgi:hypothetical protein